MSRKKYIDRIDLDLLNTLGKNPKMTVAELGDEVDLTPGPTHTRLVHLEEEGFFKNTIEIDYSKFGIDENLLSIKLKVDYNQEGPYKPETEYNNLIKILEKAQESLIISIDLLKDEEIDSYWINVRYFNRYSLKTIEQGSPKSKKDLQVSDKDEIKKLLSAYIDEFSILKVVKKKIVHPALDAGHVIRKKVNN